MPKDYNVRQLAEQIHCDRRNVYRIFEKENIDIVLLKRLSIALNHDFFKDLSESLSEESFESDNSSDT